MTSFRIFCKECGFWCGVYRMMVYLYLFETIQIKSTSFLSKQQKYRSSMIAKKEISSSSNLNLSQQRDQQLQKYLQNREKLFSDTFSNVQLKAMNLTDEETVIEKQRKRLGVADRRLTLQQLSFGAISNSNNLFNLVKEKKAKIINVTATQYQIKIIIQADRCWTISLQSGTLLYPAKQESNQTLIICKSINVNLKPGINYLKADTFCYNRQFSAPSNEPYLLGSIKCLMYSTQMNQTQVWEITMKKKEYLKHFKGKVEKQEVEQQKRIQYIAITKARIHEILSQWK